jgi:hypothetical protein
MTSSTHDIWVGSNYVETNPRMLVLGESVYGSGVPLKEYLPTWIHGAQRDQTFSRVFNALSGVRAASTTVQARQSFWDGVAFYNFVTIVVGALRSSRPTREAYMASRDSLRQVISQYRPHGVLILGKEQAGYSGPVVRETNVPFEVSPTGFGIKTSWIAKPWKELREKLRATNNPLERTRER